MLEMDCNGAILKGQGRHILVYFGVYIDPTFVHFKLRMFVYVYVKFKCICVRTCVYLKVTVRMRVS